MSSSTIAANEATRKTPNKPLISDDLFAIVAGGLILLISFCCITLTPPTDGAVAENATSAPADASWTASHALTEWIVKPSDWTDNPLATFTNKNGDSIVLPIVVVGLAGLILFSIAILMQRQSILRFAPAFCIVFLLAVFAYMLSGQALIKASNFEYVIWALLAGLMISNTIGTPAWLKPALRTELYIKTGLVIFGAEILLSRLLALGLPGIFVAWVVTPIVLVTTYWFGQKILKIGSASLNMVISADMSVCGVSAAIATAAACRAKKEELSLAIGLSLCFTAIMMIVMPLMIQAVGMDPILGGAWIGGTIDATGAVAAAGSVLGTEAAEVAMTIKMIQNILIGVVSFFVATYWVTFVEPLATGLRPGIGEIWNRFPKFVLGFMGASLVCSYIFANWAGGPELVDSSMSVTKTIRGWLFCLAFVSIGLETNFRELAVHLKGGKPLILYVCGQTLNLILTLAMAWLMFNVVFPESR